ncbi:MAG: DUF126 domain-containing protein [Candidatus Hydrothermarchaeota archaeon]|jgi:hypothetical protein|nr:DUF126 domain-containing protein [Candidatus Hydrothermarchaeota archaeon]MDP6613363.1 DUF126 domain-containing protein [Candidatus Hydrothermarchaeota archaeon]
MRIQGRTISKGCAEGKALVTREPLSFLGGVDSKTGVVMERGHELEGRSLKDKILLFPQGKGSTVGSYVLYQMKKNNTAPGGIINHKAEEVVATGAIISGIPMLDSLKRDPYEILKDGMKVRLDADQGFIEVD